MAIPVPKENSLPLPALSRPLRLGMLYDWRSDTLIPGITLWDYETLQKDVRVQPQPKTECQILASDNYDNLASALSLTLPLKTSLLAGKVDLNGSARYLKDRKKSKNQVRVVLHYSITTHFRELTMSHLGPQNIAYPEVFEQAEATHVVTAVLYGAQAFFVFDREVASSENKEEIEKELRATVQTLSEESKGGDGCATVLRKEKTNTENFRCTFYGDITLENNPITDSDVMKIYSNFPKLLGENGEKAVPVKVWLYPLAKLDHRAPQLVREISVGLITRAEAAVEQLKDCEMQCQDLVGTSGSRFPVMSKKIKHFQSLCKQHREIFQDQLAGILPAIRGGRQEEAVLRDILTREEQSPFSPAYLTEFLRGKSAEMDFVNWCCTSVDNVDIIPYKNKLKEVLFYQKFKFLVSFTFTSLKKEEPYLQDLEEWIKKTSDPEYTTSAYEKPKSQQWFEDDRVFDKARECIKSFSGFAKFNKKNGKTQFIISSAPDEDNPGVSIYLYEDGKLVSRNFEPPSTPLPLQIGEIRHDGVQFLFEPTSDNILGYWVEYRILEQENWTALDIKKSEEIYLMRDLLPNTNYKFRHAVRSKVGFSLRSRESEVVKTLPTDPPGKPQMLTVSSSDIRVTWKIPGVIGEGAVIKEYAVEYREEAGKESHEGKDKWNEKRTGKTATVCHFDGLKPQTPYRFRVSAVCADGALSAPSEEVAVATSTEEEERENRPAHQYLQKSTLVENGQPAVYALPLQKATSDASASCPTYQLGEENVEKPTKVIMVMGASGSGKTTLINGMINYILGVRWQDNFRFKLVQEVTNQRREESQTSEVTAYVVNYQEGFQVPYSLMIIDTPGFGERPGVGQGKWLIMQIIKFLCTSGCTDHIDVVCFVTRASFDHVTCAQKYIFDFVSYIFGKDIKDNIQVLVTFVDRQTPPVLEAIKEADVPCAKDARGSPVHFKFNNSALFASNLAEHGGTPNFDETFWTQGTSSMELFFDSLNNLETKSLVLTKKVLREWKVLEMAVGGLQLQIQAGLVRLEALRKTQEALGQHRKQMAANKDFKFVIEKVVPMHPNSFGSRASRTSCQGCLFTCHYPCQCPDEEDKRTCQAIDQLTGKCRFCPGRCAWNVHFCQKYWLEYKTVKEEKFYSELNQSYPHASAEAMTEEKMLQHLSQEYDEGKEALLGLIQRSSQGLQRLQEIALKPKPLSTPEYIDLLIEAEEQEQKSGYVGRIQSLREVREMSELREQTAGGQGAPAF
ncbi:uncharacterized protein LOC133365466 [Rhineura floridana]|uniref:uncharacterized protein LOC133365466 n=1 Tax=Rhineura floridana TaxID=261503 RepID=UPI002AC82F61|nr:uncharacterized protein LOC133365466 [Rhineura floridana]XP_061443383.1 uncharacterized protein LOC133365466 [Rhineura floridana]